MRDNFGRRIEWLRISVTDRCDLRCFYCLPPTGVELVDRRAILSFEEIEEVARCAVGLGITKLRLTGGEPLVRRGVVDLVARLSAIAGLEDLAMSTNATRLREFARELSRAGLRRVNISLDTLDAREFSRITGGGNLEQVLDGIRAAHEAGLRPIKLNCVIESSPNEPNARSVAEFGARQGHPVRYIRRMNFERGDFRPVIGGRGGDCPRCNRLRLSSDGRVRPCLFSDLGFSVRELGIEEALRRAVAEKPEHGGACRYNWMRVSGG